MYPYPSGPAHQGHVRNYTFGDLLVRHRTMQGHAVLSPIGFDSFGLPAENAAIKTGIHPGSFTDARIEELKASLQAAGGRLRLAPGDPQPRPAYMRWNQVIFQRFLEAGLAYRQERAGQLVPGLPDRAGQRAGPGGRHLRTQRRPGRSSATWSSGSSASPPTPTSCWTPWTTWTWPERVKTMQRNWIGRSEGAEFDLRRRGHATTRIRVFTTRPDTVVRDDVRRPGPRAPAGRP